MNRLREIIQNTQAWYCLDCGKCSSVCPVTLHMVEGYASPRLLVENALVGGEEYTLEDPLLWSCLTCQRCSEICPSEVDFSSFVQETRQLAVRQGFSGECTHSGMIQSWMELMTDPALKQNRLDWITEDLQVDDNSDTIYFPGCLAYYEVAFGDLGIEGLEIARSAVKVLNSLGIAPRVLADERCCGHDLYWQGDREGFQKLASLNIEILSVTGAKQIITTCPECAYTLKETYPEEVGDHGMKVFHLTEFLEGQGSLPLKEETQLAGRAVTYQDPCRLGRFAGIYQEPRDILAGLGSNLLEMGHSREESICCGTSCWTSCGSVNKGIQAERLREARETGAEMLVTACPKCQIHLKCAQRDPVRGADLQIPIRDITTLLAENC